MKIKILNAIWSEGDNKNILDKVLYLDTVYWKKVRRYKVSSKTSNTDIKPFLKEEFDSVKDAGNYCKELQTRFPAIQDFTVSMWRRKQEVKTRKQLSKNGVFYTGFINRIVTYCNEQGIEISIEGEKEIVGSVPPFIVGKIPRVDQERQLAKAISEQRGTLVAPTGSGKTLLAAWLFSAFPHTKRLFLCHTTVLVTQAFNDFISYGFNSEDISIVGDGTKNATGKIVIATRQSFINIPKDAYYEFDMVIVDETHHVSSFDGQYANILRELPCPIRIGLTATPPLNQEAIMAIEGLLGPNIDSVTLKEGIEKEILAKPILRVISVPRDSELAQLGYEKAYDLGIINRKARNRLIMKIVKEQVSNNETCLLLIDRREHGERLLEMAELLQVPAVYIQGSTENEVRENVRESLKNKDIPCVIATQIWNEGVNIPSLDNILLVGDSKSIQAILQKIGRGLRRTEEKKTVKIWDFFDRSSRYFVDHFGERIAAYCEHKINMVFDDEK